MPRRSLPPELLEFEFPSDDEEEDNDRPRYGLLGDSIPGDYLYDQTVTTSAGDSFVVPEDVLEELESLDPVSRQVRIDRLGEPVVARRGNPRRFSALEVINRIAGAAIEEAAEEVLFDLIFERELPSRGKLLRSAGIAQLIDYGEGATDDLLEAGGFDPDLANSAFWIARTLTVDPLEEQAFWFAVDVTPHVIEFSARHHPAAAERPRLSPLPRETPLERELREAEKNLEFARRRLQNPDGTVSEELLSSAFAMPMRMSRRHDVGYRTRN